MSATIQHQGFSPKDPTEEVFLGFDFALLTPLPGAPVVTVAWHSGEADASPEAIKSGSASVVGATVVQKVTGGVAGANYLLRCRVDAPDGSRYVLAGLLPVRAV